MPDLRGQPGWIARLQAERLREWLEQFPAVALLGPRQVGKTSLALQLAAALPRLGKGFHQARADLQPERCFLVTPASAGYPLAEGVEVVSLAELAKRLRAEG